MSRRMNTAARGRQANGGGGRMPQLKLTFGGKSGRKNGSREITTLAKPTKKKKKIAVMSEDEDSTSNGGFSDEEFDEIDEESEEADDESEDPEADAPSHFAIPALRDGMGLPESDEDPALDMPDDGEWFGFPEPKPDDVQIELFKDVDLGDIEKKLFDSDDDDMVYERVNEVSDSDDDDEAIQRAETDILTAEFNEELTSHFANQIEGMSAYGFGSGSEDEESVCFPFSSSDEANETTNRRVHFEEDPPVGLANAFAALADSPTMTRALLPSALPEEFGMGAGAQALSQDAEDQDFDSDATEELPAPEQRWQSKSRKNSTTEKSPPAHSPPPKRSTTQKGPVRGTFHDNGDKVTAILDPSGTRLVIQDPHLLGGVFARRFGPSVPASPSVGFSDAVFGETDSSQASGSPRPHSAQLSTVDPMFSALTSGDNAATNGQATGLPEAFLPAESFMNDFISGDIFDDLDFDPEATLRIEDMIAFEGDDDENANSPMPNFSQQETMSAPPTPLPHLSSMNVTAFRRNAEATYFSSPHPDPLKHKFTTPLKRKRKSAKYDSPYNDSHYNGVTPVQRITYHELSSSPAPASHKMHKRRKTMF